MLITKDVKSFHGQAELESDKGEKQIKEKGTMIIIVSENIL